MSVATVSRALSKPQDVNPETRKRVLAVVERLSYRPNLIARSLRVGQTKSLLMVIPTLSPFFLDIYAAAEEAARDAGFSMLLGSGGGNAERELAYFDQVISGRADGIISLTGFVPSQYAPGKRTLPPIIAALKPLQGHSTPLIRVDDRMGATVATQHLIELGHKRIAHITGHPKALSTAERLAGYKEALQSAAIAHDPQLIEPGDFSVASGATAMERLLSTRAALSGVFASNDEMAFGAMMTLRRHGLIVPEDMSVVGFDDQTMAAVYNPPLTTIHIPRLEIGHRAARELINVLNGDHAAGEVMLRTHLIERESTAKPRRARAPKRRP
jgi:LacI family transcriptional regulator, repressor for deo operon, udp, cdd, tsx, nupC, and nupG